MSLDSETGSGEMAAADPADPAPPAGRGRRRQLLLAAGGAVAVVLLYLAYLGQSRSLGADSDAASNVLQAWDMLHGNLLLRHWSLSDVSFYTTELPQYMLVELFRGLNPAVIHLAGAATYTLLMVLVALLAKGRDTGTTGLTRMLVAAGIMLAPGPGIGAASLLSTPDHIGTQVPLVIIWLLIDRLPDRWYLPLTVGVLLTWVEVADTMAVYVGALPVIIIAAIRVAQRRPSRRIDAGLLAAAAVSVAASAAILRLIHHVGGFRVAPTRAMFIPSAQLAHNVSLTIESVLALFGADFFGLRLGWPAAVALLHLAGVLLAGWAVWIAGRRLLSCRERVVPILFLGLVINVTAYLISTQAIDLGATHELAAVLPFGAALAGRLLPGTPRLRSLRAVLAAVLACYTGALVYYATRPAQPPTTQPVASWLTSRHLSAGLGDYWTANITTVATGGQVRVRSVVSSCGRFIPDIWESKKTWYERPNTATFLVLALTSAAGADGTTAQAQAQFGAAQQMARVGAYEILVWQHNLLPALTRAPAPGCG
ncbi:MAG TPA: hypothetical protein VGG50_14980 [Streptosporangiaceae bacterium]